MSQDYTLSELNSKVKTALQNVFNESYRIIAEISEIRESGGHAFLELIEKSPDGKTIAKARANIWAYTYRMLKPYFESTTGHSLAQGLKVLVVVSIEFSEIYGYSLTIRDIDPTYTLGDIEQRKSQILRDLEQDGVIGMNKELEICDVPQRIAVISSETAAGYDDFINQLKNNKKNFRFEIKLFNTIMQGDKSEESLIKSLEKIYESVDNFDIVVIIRGGGSKSDLSCFDNYWPAYNVAQFPLPVITGIGHERDTSILDLVAHTSLKTPTAVAEFLIEKLDSFNDSLLFLENELKEIVSDILENEKRKINDYSVYLSVPVMNTIRKQENSVSNLSFELKSAVSNYVYNMENILGKLNYDTEKAVKANINKMISNVENLHNQFHSSVNRYFVKEKNLLSVLEHKNNLLSPLNTLKRGYSYTTLNGKLLKSVCDVSENQTITTHLFDGEIDSVVK